MFVLFCDPFKTLASIKAFSLDGTSKLSTTPKILFDDAGSDAIGLRFSSSLVLVVFDQKFCWYTIFAPIFFPCLALLGSNNEGFSVKLRTFDFYLTLKPSLFFLNFL
jgi:hypothetical protein